MNALEAAPDLDDIGYEFRREALLELEGPPMNSSPPPSRPYRPSVRQPSAEELAAVARRNGIDPALATSRAARAAAVPDVLPVPPPAVKGAVKVDAFPDRCRFPFRQIAADGGVWKLDPAEFNLKKAESLRTYACSWARDHGVAAKTMILDGQVYVQFTRRTS